MKRLVLIIIILFCFTSNVVWSSEESHSETIIYELVEPKYGSSKVPVELLIPSKPTRTPVPLIITQHGSTRDGGYLQKSIVQTDEYSKRLVKAANEWGFAIAVIDAFYNKGLNSSQKLKFPKARIYGRQVALALSENKKLDSKNFFYTGFSYGGSQANMMIEKKYFGKRLSWAGIVAAEPGCTVFIKPRAFSVPLLVLKGGESHYAPKPCITMIKLYQNAGAKVELIIFPKSNHFFSHNGYLTKGLAFNGCDENPILIFRGSGEFLDGTKVTKRSRKKCFTNNAGGGKSREDLDTAVKSAMKFFKRNLR
jgi:dienelactone hydrolase